MIRHGATTEGAHVRPPPPVVAKGLQANLPARDLLGDRPAREPNGNTFVTPERGSSIGNYPACVRWRHS
jgi:hypothetical protein